MRFNEEAAKERQRNREFIRAYEGREVGGYKIKVLDVDCDNARYKGTLIKDLDSYHRRKFENLLFFSEQPQPIEVTYH